MNDSLTKIISEKLDAADNYRKLKIVFVDEAHANAFSIEDVDFIFEATKKNGKQLIVIDNVDDQNIIFDFQSLVINGFCISKIHLYESVKNENNEVEERLVKSFDEYSTVQYVYNQYNTDNSNTLIGIIN